MKTTSPGNWDIFNLAWPIAMNAILLQLILVIDTVLVTPLGEEALAAMGLAASIAGMIMGLMFAFSNGTQLIIAQAYGAKKPSAINIGFRAGRIINGIIACLGILFIFTIGKLLIDSIASTTSMASMAYDYLRIFSVVIIGIAICQNITVYFNATGNSRLPFYANISELPINAAVSYVLIYGVFGFPELGLTGAAIGSAVAVMTRSMALMFFYSRDQKKQQSAKNNVVKKITKSDLLNHLKFATPIAGTFISMVLAANVCTLIYAKLSINQFAALTLILPWIKIAGHLSTGWAQSTGILVGQLLGNKSWTILDSFVSKSWRALFLIAVVISLLYLGMFYLFEAIYPELQNETLNTLWQFMPILLVLPFIRTSNTICGHVLRAGGDAKHVFKIHALTQWLVTVPLSVLFVLYWELSAVWVFGLILLEELIKGIPFHLRMHGGEWKKSLV